MKKTILITGSRGLIGTALSERLIQKGHTVRRLVRQKTDQKDTYYWDPLAGNFDEKALVGTDCVVHLAGEPIAQRWNKKSKEAILKSRVLGTRLLVDRMKALNSPAALISTSGINFYGAQAGFIYKEDQESTPMANPGDGFLSEVCREWEQETQALDATRNRVVLLRTGVVLSKKGGALARLLMPFKLGLGGVVGSGTQWMSWIELHDLVKIFIWAIEGDFSGSLNAVSPNPVQNKVFLAHLGKILKRPTVIPLPKFIVHMLFGAMGHETLLADIGVMPYTLINEGFQWECAEINKALLKALKDNG